MKKNKLFDESYEKEQIKRRIISLSSDLDLPDQANVNSLLEILKCFMATNSVLKRFLQVFGKGNTSGIFDEQERIIADIVKSYQENK